MSSEEEFEAEEIEIEEYGKKGGEHPHPRARRYVTPSCATTASL